MEENIVSCPYQKSGAQEIPTTDFGRKFFESLRTYSTAVVYECVETGNKITFDELRVKAEALARHLLSFGVSKGDALAIFSPNSIEWVIVAAAVLRIGVVLAGVNCLLTTGELQYHLKLIGAKAIYTTQVLAKTTLEAKAKLTQKLPVIVNGAYNNCIPLESLLQPLSTLPLLPSFDELDLKPSDIALIMFSSGTTGPQKSVQLTHRNLQAQFICMNHPRAGFIFPNAIDYLPFSHASGFYWIMFSPLLGYKSFIVQRFDFKLILNCLQEKKPDRLILVPTIAILMAKSPEVEKFQLGHLKVMFCGAAPLGSETEQLIMERLPGVSFKQCYGMTEVTGITIADPYVDENRKRKPGSIGFPLINMQVKVVDLESGKALGPNQKGEICMRGPLQTPGYKDNPQATDDLIDKDGWSHSGDIGYYDTDRSFFVIDRLKELIKYNAFQVAPAELDTILLSHPEVADACVFGIPDAKAGELPMACVVLKPGSRITDLELEQFVAGKVAPYKRLRGGVRFVDAIPKLPSGKLLRRQLREAQLKSRV